MLKRFVLLVAVMMVTLVVLSGVALAAGQLDQQNLVPTDGATDEGLSIYGSVDTAQTFTAGRTGELDKVSVYLAPNAGGPVPAGSVISEIYPTDSSGNPDTNTQPLGSGSIPSSSLTFPWVDITLSQSAPVTQGTVYALVVRAVDADPNHPGFGGYLSWFRNAPGEGRYAMGNEADRWLGFPWNLHSSQDRFFKTFVTTSTPASSSDTEAPTVAKATPPATRGA